MKKGDKYDTFDTSLTIIYTYVLKKELIEQNKQEPIMLQSRLAAQKLN
jgi:hypothetical protein